MTPFLKRRVFEAFNEHRAICTRCSLADPEQPASLALACLQGSALMKEALNAVFHQDAELRKRGGR